MPNSRPSILNVGSSILPQELERRLNPITYQARELEEAIQFLKHNSPTMTIVDLHTMLAGETYNRYAGEFKSHTNYPTYQNAGSFLHWYQQTKKGLPTPLTLWHGNEGMEADEITYFGQTEGIADVKPQLHEIIPRACSLMQEPSQSSPKVAVVFGEPGTDKSEHCSLLDFLAQAQAQALNLPYIHKVHNLSKGTTRDPRPERTKSDTINLGRFQQDLVDVPGVAHYLNMNDVYFIPISQLSLTQIKRNLRSTCGDIVDRLGSVEDCLEQGNLVTITTASSGGAYRIYSELQALMVAREKAGKESFPIEVYRFKVNNPSTRFIRNIRKFRAKLPEVTYLKIMQNMDMFIESEEGREDVLRAISYINDQERTKDQLPIYQDGQPTQLAQRILQFKDLAERFKDWETYSIPHEVIVTDDPYSAQGALATKFLYEPIKTLVVAR
jgi:hypothetical protein